MSGMQISLALQTDKTVAEYIALAKLINQFPFDIVSVYCDAPFHPSYGPLNIMAPHLKTARLGPAAVSPYRIHPIDIAANTALVADHASGGVYIGLARGAWLEEHGISEPKKPIQAMREAIQIVRCLLSGQSAGLDGEYFRISDHVRAPYPLPEEDIPLMIGTWGPKMAKLAGELADEVKIGGSVNTKMVGYLKGYISEGEELAGRMQGAVGIVMGAVTVVDEDRALARKLARREVALYLPIVAALDPTIEVESDWVERLRETVRQGDLDSAEGLISDDVLDLFALSGSPQDIIDQVSGLFEAGVSRIEFGTPHGLEPEIGIQLVGSKVLPEILRIIGQS